MSPDLPDLIPGFIWGHGSHGVLPDINSCGHHVVRASRMEQTFVDELVITAYFRGIVRS